MPSQPHKPASVAVATTLFWASLGVGLVNGGLAINAVPPDELAFALVIAAIVIGTMAFVIIKISQGKNWARITFLVVWIFGLPFAVISTPWWSARNLPTALELLALVLLFTSPSNEWFRKMRALRLLRDLRQVDSIDFTKKL